MTAGGHGNQDGAHARHLGLLPHGFDVGERGRPGGDRDMPLSISSISDGSSARYPLAGTAPCPLPCRRKFAERSAADGSSMSGPAIEPIWIQFRARLRSARARSSAMIVSVAGLPHR